MNQKKILRSVFVAVVSAFLVFMFASPMALLLLNSVKNEAESAVLSFTLPTEWRFDNYVTVLQTGNVIRSFFNGLLIAGSLTVLTILISSMAAYIIARRASRWCTAASTYILAGMIAPFSFVPAIKLLQILNLYGSYTGIILIDVALQLPFTTFMFIGFIRGVPKELDEAATIDGCGPLRQFFLVIFPTLKPAIATNVILLFTAGWNSFQNILYLMPDSAKWTMPMSVFNFQGLHSFDYGLVCANMVLSILPMLAMYIGAQKYIMKGVMAGSVKG